MCAMYNHSQGTVEQNYFVLSDVGFILWFLTISPDITYIQSGFEKQRTFVYLAMNQPMTYHC